MSDNQMSVSVVVIIIAGILLFTLAQLEHINKCFDRGLVQCREDKGSYWTTPESCQESREK